MVSKQVNGFQFVRDCSRPARQCAVSRIAPFENRIPRKGIKAMANQIKQENFFEQSVWVLFLVLGVIEILFGVGDMIAGIENDPAILISATGITPAELKAQDPLIYNALDQQQKTIGHVLLMTGLLVSVVSLTAFRGGA